MIIEIHDREFAESEALQTALARTLWHQNVKKVDIFISSRVPDDAPEWKNPEWLEYGLLFEYETGGQMFVAMIQRKRGADYEFHS